MNRIATKLPEGRMRAHRRRPIWLLLALLTLGPAVGLAQTYTTIDCPDSFSTGARTSTTAATSSAFAKTPTETTAFSSGTAASR